MESSVSNIYSKVTFSEKIMVVSAIMLTLTLAIAIFLVTVHLKQPSETLSLTAVVTAEMYIVPTHFKQGTWYHHASSSTMPIDNPVQSVCSTEECRTAARYYGSILDVKVNPCENFYQYVCGGWLKNSRIPDDKLGVSLAVDPNLEKKLIQLLSEPQVLSPRGAIGNARAFYQGCVASEQLSEQVGISKLRKLISEFVNPKHQDWQSQLANIVKELGLNFIMSLEVGVDEMNSKKMMIYLDQPSFILPVHTLINAHRARERGKINAYKKFMKETFCQMNGKCFANNEKGVRKEVDDILEMERQLAMFLAPGEERRDPLKMYIKRTLGKLASSIPQFKWMSYLNKIFRVVGTKVDESTEVIVRGESYFKEAAPFLQSTKNKTVSNYITWSLINEFAPFVMKSFRKSQFEFKRVLFGIKKPISMKSLCVGKVSRLMGNALLHLYVNKYFSKDAKLVLEEMVKDLKNSLHTMLDQNEWMDAATKSQAKEKLSTFKEYIAFPSWILNKDELNEYYAINPVNRNDVIGSYRKLLSLSAKQGLLKLENPEDPTRIWGINPIDPNAYYEASKNAIFFTATILQPPYYLHNSLKALNYGAIGHVIGHEITHGFDDEGSLYDASGNLRNWWSNEAKLEFNKRTECFLQLYSNMTEPQAKIPLNAEITIGEDIADNGGIREAFNAFSSRGFPDQRLPGLENITPNQLFFIAAASIYCSKSRVQHLRNEILEDSHSPPMFRANLPLANEENFAKAFNCKLGSFMNPKNRCVMW